MNSCLCEKMKLIAFCGANCESTHRCRTKGVFPRGLVPEQRDVRLDEVALLIVGMNPARMADHVETSEREEYTKFNGKYTLQSASCSVASATWRIWHEKVAYTSYYYRDVRDLLTSKNIWKQRVLWANIVYCENTKAKELSEQAVRHCCDKYFKHILSPDFLPRLQRVIVVGNRAMCAVKKQMNAIPEEEFWNHRKLEVVRVYHPSPRSRKYFALLQSARPLDFVNRDMGHYTMTCVGVYKKPKSND